MLIEIIIIFTYFAIIAPYIVRCFYNLNSIFHTNLFNAKKEDGCITIYQWPSIKGLKHFKIQITEGKSACYVFNNELKTLFNALDPNAKYTASTHLIRVFQSAERQHLLTYTAVKTKKKSIWLEVLFFIGLSAAFKELKKKRKRQFYLITFYKK